MSVTKKVIHEGLTTKQAIDWLNQKLEQEETVTKPSWTIPGYPLDVMVSLYKAIKHTYGLTVTRGDKTPFGDSPPTMISVPTSPTSSISVPIGKMILPDLEGGHLLSAPTTHQGKPALAVSGLLKRKHMEIAQGIIDLTKVFLQENSIYKSKAIQLAPAASDEANPLLVPPRFLPPITSSPSDLILRQDITEAIRSLLWAPILQSQKCREARIPLKRGVLLSGPYGTGKTMAVSITARLAAENGWTFIKNDHPSLLPDAIAMAEWYQPSVVFCEDIDTCSPENRNEQVNDLLNTIDGIEKDREVMVVFTTNHVDQIGPALLRPGRIDAVINFDPPDGPTAGRLIRHYGKDLISPKTSTEQAGSILAGAPASMIREVVERAKLNAISNSRRIDHLTEDDLTYAAKSLSQHLSLCIPSQRISPTPISAKTAEEFGVGLGEGLKKSLLLHQDPIHVE